MEAAANETEYNAASKSFKAIYDYKDSSELYQKCLEIAENIRQDLEQRQKQERDPKRRFFVLLFIAEIRHRTDAANPRAYHCKKFFCE